MEFLQDHPFAFVIVLIMGAVIGMAVERFVETQDREKRKAYWRGRKASNGGLTLKKLRAQEKAAKYGFPLATDQLQTVMNAAFTPRALLNRPEAKVFVALDQAVIARNPKWQVMAQVSLGEFLASPDKDAYLAVNSKRVDFALMDEHCCVRHALEYQGNGHHQAAAAARDAVKKEALRKAGIGYHEIVAGHTTPSELRALVEKLVPGG